MSLHLEEGEAEVRADCHARSYLESWAKFGYFNVLWLIGNQL